MSYYKHHVFFCLNQRENGDDCCALHHAKELFDYAKTKCKELGIAGQQGVRVNKAGCLDRCEHGPVMVVYPQGVWYTAVDTSDVDEIIQKHLIGGEVVQRLLIN